MTKISFLKLILIIFSILIIAGTGYAGWGIWKEIENIENQTRELIIKPRANIETETSEIDTSDWLTYRNEEYGYYIQYPPFWRLEIYNHDIVSFYPSDLREHERLTQGGEIELFYMKNPKKLSLQEFYDGPHDFYPFTAESISEIRISGINGFRFTNVEGRVRNENSDLVIIPLPIDIIEIIDVGGHHEKDGIFDSMISSFKF